MLDCQPAPVHAAPAPAVVFSEKSPDDGLLNGFPLRVISPTPMGAPLDRAAVTFAPKALFRWMHTFGIAEPTPVVFRLIPYVPFP